MKKEMIVMMRQSVVSGMMVGLGVIINLLVDNRYAGAMLFSVALLVIIQNQIPLYTGRIGYIRKFRITDLLLILIFNLIGIILPVLLVVFSRDGFLEKLQTVSEAKFANGFLELFCLGALCGVLMLIAVHSKVPVITVFCIMVFILSGYEHCIADFPFLTVNFSLGNLGKFLCIVLGNSVGSIVTYELLRKEE